MVRKVHPPLTWILVANSESALFFETSHKQIHFLQEMQHREGREKVSEIVTDRPGRTFARTGIVRHMLNQGEEIHRHEQEKFAHELFRLCQGRKQERSFDRLILIAPPPFLGVLRHEFDKDLILKQSIVKEIAKEVVPAWSMEQKIDYISSLLES